MCHLPQPLPGPDHAIRAQARRRDHSHEIGRCDSVINPIVARAEGVHSVGLGWQLGSKGNTATFLNIGAFISALIYSVIFMAVIYFVIVLPYKANSARRGVAVFGEPPPVKTCPACLFADLPAAASKCKYCGTDQPAASAGPATAR
jgi:large conductance mechanosensitive channel